MPIPVAHRGRRRVLRAAVASLVLLAWSTLPADASRADGAARAYRASILATPGKAGFWGLDESPATRRAADLGGKSAGRYVGAVKRGAPGLTSGSASSARFNGRGQHIAVAHTSAVSLRAPWTFEAIVRPERIEPRRRQRILAKDGAYAWGIARAGRLFLTTFGVDDYITTRAYVKRRAVYHLAVRLDRRADATFFVNGRRVETVRGEGAPRSSRRPLRLAGPRSGGARGLVGRLDEVALYARGLSDEEVAGHARQLVPSHGDGVMTPAAPPPAGAVPPPAATPEAGAPASDAPTEPEDPAVPLRQARSAWAFVDSIGVNVHMNYNGSQYYNNAARLARELSDIGIRHVRDGHQGRRPDQRQRLNTLADAGIGITLIEDPRSDPQIPGDTPSMRPARELPERYGRLSIQERIQELRDGKIRNVVALEGANEYDRTRDFGDLQWVPTLKNAQCWLRQLRDEYLPELALYGPSHTNWEAYEATRVAGLAPCVPIGNVHPYPNDGPPTSATRPGVPGYNASLRWHVVEEVERLSGRSGSPWAATETGYHTAINHRGGHRSVREAVEAVYAPRVFLEYFRQGAHRTFWYEAVGQWPNPQRDQPESNFGLLRNDFSRKPAAQAVRNLIAEVTRPGPATEGSLRYESRTRRPASSRSCCAAATGRSRSCCGATSAYGTDPRD